MEILELGKTPISPENPAGEDIRYEPEFEELQAEIEKLSSPTSTGAVDWEKVVRISGKILAEKSKNLVAAGYLCLGLLHTEGAQGLSQATGFFTNLVETFWQDLYPPKKRMRGRKNAIAWLTEKIQVFVESLPDDARLGEEEKSEINGNLDRLDAFLAENMDDAPLLRPLKNRVAAIPSPPQEQEATPEDFPKPGATEAPGQDAEPTPPPASSLRVVPQTRAAPAPEAVGTDQDARRVLRRGLDDIRQAAAIMRQKDIGNPEAYRLTRIAAWIDVENTPPATGGKTLIPPPVEEYANTLKNLHQQGNHRDLVEAAESGVGQYLFWLDLTRYVSEGLSAMGHDKAAESVNSETALYLGRLGGVEKLAFSDGTPFADEDTREWLKLLTTAREADMPGPGGPAAGATDAEAAAIAESYTQARDLVRQKKLIEALEFLQDDLDPSASGKSGLLRRMNLARLLLDAGKPRAALPHLRQILADLDRHKLDEWNPAAAVNALTLVYHGFKKQNLKEVKNQADGVLERIARLNPAVAVRLAD